MYDEKSFKENARVVKQVVELLQNYKIRYTQKQQYLSDFFELLLTTGLKQESGQFFTPVPIAQFIIKSLPIDSILEAKLKEGVRDELLPYIIDYAAGSGHFLTESMHEIHRLLNKVDAQKLKADTRRSVESWRINHFEWALKYIYGIEKDYRLVKVGKVGCYLHGDGLANVIHSDGLSNFKNPDYKGRLRCADKDFPQDNKQFDVVISNPPYSVSAFKNAAREYYSRKDFELYERLTDNSSEIECLFIERTKQLLKDGGVAGIILPSSILSNANIYTKAREIILQYFDVIAIAELGSNTFMATGTNTVVLFLRRRNNYDSINLKKSVNKFFTDLRDVTLNGIGNPVAKYVEYVWVGLTLRDYISLVQRAPNTSVANHELYQEYRNKIKLKTEKDFWDAVIERETEKLYYFIVTYPQKVVLVKSGEKDAEKRFLGYEFSNRRGNEGIHPVHRGKSIDECTKLFDAELFDNPEKASTYIYKAFSGDFDLAIDESMSKNVARGNLVDMLTFDRADFEKNISLSAKKKVDFKNIWSKGELVLLSDIASIQKGTTITKEKTESGKIPVVAGGQTIAYYHSIANRDGNVITISASGAYSGFVNYFNHPIFASDCNTVQSKNEKNISTKLIYHFLKSIQSEIYRLQKGQAQPHVYSEDIAKIKIPLPPKEIQRKIVSEIEKIETKGKLAKDRITKNTGEIEKLFEAAYKTASTRYRLSDNDAFSLSIGKRVLEHDLASNGTVPVYSANVLEPFGNVNKLLIKDFSSPSVLWGIDGDWMVNYVPENKHFYPTDHCGVLRVLNKNIQPKYLAWCLRKEGQMIGFSRKLRASIDRIAGITIKVPSITKQCEIISKIETLEKRTEKLEKIISKSEMQKKTVLEKYL